MFQLLAKRQTIAEDNNFFQTLTDKKHTMKRTLFIFSICFLLSNYLSAQNNKDVLLTIGNESVSRYEFEQIYLKNSQMISDTDKKSVDEYLDMFIVYKLKVAEAKSMGIHNTNEFKQEFANYRKQLLQPQLVDKEEEQRLLQEAYQRSKVEVNASHILITIPEDASPDDTLMLYNKTMSIRKRVLENADFGSVARATSDDPSVKMNGGNLGYFSVFQMVYPFENAAYNTPVDSISQPIRSQFGYHLVKVNSRRPSIGQIKTAHIMIASPASDASHNAEQTKHLIDSIYMLVRTNEDFALLAQKYSQDPGTASNGGELPWFGMKQMPPEFEKAAFDLANLGDISKPVKTQFGWHIIKLLEKRKVGSFDEMLPELKARLARDVRSRVPQVKFVNHLKAENNYMVDTSALNTLKFVLDSSFYTGNWKLPKYYKDQFLFAFAGQKYTLSDLSDRLNMQYKNFANQHFATIVERSFNEMVNSLVISFEQDRLLAENSEIKYLLKEYHDGILLFAIMDMSVWAKSTQDQAGQQKYYNENIQKYSWPKRIYGQLFTSNKERNLKKALRVVKSRKGRNMTTDELVNKGVTKKDTIYNVVEFAVNPDDSWVRGFELWENLISDINNKDNSYYFVRVLRQIENDPKPIDEVRGQLIADYQTFLEEEWVESLKRKYTVTINKPVYQQVISNLN